MSNKLAQLLSYLDRNDVVRLRFRDGQAVMLETTTRAHPVTVTPLGAAQIRKFFAGTPVEKHISVLPPAPQAHRLELMGKQYAIEVHAEDGKLAIDVAPGQRADANVVRVIRDATPIPRPRPPLQSARELPRGTGIPQHTIRDPPSAPSISGAPPRPVLDATPVPPSEAGVPRVSIRDPSSARQTARTRDDNRSRARARTHSEPPARPKRSPADSPGHRPRRPPQRAAERREKSGPAPLSDELRQILLDAVKTNASDVHLVAAQPLRVRRVGRLEPSGSVLAADHVADLIKPLLELRQHEQVASRGYTDLSVDIPEVGRFRLNVSRQRTGLKACFRVVQAEPLDCDAVRLPKEVEGLTMHHQGLVIVSGPNGHGKTTSMAAILDLFNRTRPVHIITVEDPVEILHPIKHAIVTQREVGTHTKTFPTALAAALREDPDVIGIGELRDRETVEMALQASETGHLVIATMSTPSAAKTIDRMIDMFPPDDQPQVRASLAGALKLIFSQRLVRNTKGDGRVAAFEMITGNVPLWTLIRDKKLYQLPSLMQRGRNYGMLKLDESLAELVKDGTIDEDEARLSAQDPALFGGKGG